MKDVWLPKGYKLSSDLVINSLLFSGEKWQIFDTDNSLNILIAKPELVGKWNEIGFIDASLFGEILFGVEVFQYLSSHKKYALKPVENMPSPENKTDALAFAFALRESRKLSKDTSFHDSIYLEQYSKLLPTWTSTKAISDEMVFGTWLTGGVAISINSFKRLSSLVGWMPIEELTEVIKMTGFNVTVGVQIFNKQNSTAKIKNDLKIAPPEASINIDKFYIKDKKEELGVFKLPGRSKLEDFFNEYIIDIIFNIEKYQMMGIYFPSAVVLHGPPGCGKTFAVQRLIEFIGWPSYSINSNSVASSYIHHTSKRISEIFDNAINNSPSIIVIDEMESFLSDRRIDCASDLSHIEELAEFLRRIPEVINQNVLVIAMTNRIDMIDPAIIRRGRFDHIVEVDMPSREEVELLIASLLSKVPKVENLCLDRVIDTLIGKPLSDSSFIIREALRVAAKSGKSQLDQESIDSVLNNLPKTEEKISKSVGFIWNK